MGSLQAYGAAGMLAYGLLNTIYYSGAFLFIWLYVSPVPRGVAAFSLHQPFRGTSCNLDALSYDHEGANVLSLKELQHNYYSSSNKVIYLLSNQK